ncbi:3 ketodihydrosphingosine reductase [Fasciola hepatica]|uniref:3 ketodihydrosphingosine reductase n=1 Tax=Fasciola hepatica TaxID=6192 RepID=A0A4E0RHD2_FASHE|nr:3 ketodihydrosphingosine reductase [Fasciola hepatica]
MLYLSRHVSLQIFIIGFSAFAVLLVFFLWNRSRGSPTLNVSGYNVFITGGSSGIGLALAHLFYGAGASVTLIARDMARLQGAKEALIANHGDRRRIHLLSLDLGGSYSNIEQTLSAHVALVGTADILINCAGYALSQSFIDTPVDSIESLIRINYLASAYVTKALLPHMLKGREQNGVIIRSIDRRIVFVSTMAAQVSVYGFAAYGASKCAVRGLAETLRMELEPTGPLVTLAFPPDTDTPGLAKENVGKPAATLEISAAGGLAAPEDVARTIFMDTLEGKVISAFGFEGKALSWGTAGLLPPVNACGFGWRNWLTLLIAALCEVLAAGPLRAFGIGYALWMRYVVLKHTEKFQTA